MTISMVSTRPRRFGVLAIACAALAAGTSAQASVNSPTLVFPPANAALKQPAGASVAYPTLNYSISGVTFNPIATGVPLSPSGDTIVDTYPSAGSLQFASGGVTGTAGIACTSNLTFGPDQQGSSFRFKLVAVKTIGWSRNDDSLKRIRISPTVPSTGELDYTTLSDGTYQISCFFNLNTQASFDGGQTWADAAQPLHLDLVAVPEPATALLVMGALPLASRRRRRSQTS